MLGHDSASILYVVRVFLQRHSSLATRVTLFPATRCCVVGFPDRSEINLIRANAKDLPEFAHLWHLWLPAPTLPEINGLRLHPHRKGQLKLGPTTRATQFPNAFHRSVRLVTDAFMRDNDALIIVHLYYNMC